jgi:prolyl oligopeptidase
VWTRPESFGKVGRQRRSAARETGHDMSMARPLSMVALGVFVAGCGAPSHGTVPAPPPPAATAPAASPAGAPAGGEPRLPYPASRRVDVVDTLHGVRVSDPYRWLEDASSDEVKTWMQAQATFAREKLAVLPERAALVTRFRELFDIERVGAPAKRQERYFWTQKDAGKEKDAVLYREGKKGAPSVLLDPNTWSADGSVSLGSYSVSHDGRYVAYQVKKNNSDEATLEILDVTTKKKLADTVPGAKYTWRAAWTPKNDGFYYVQVPPVGGAVTVADRPGFAEIKFHRLGTPVESDPVVRAATRDPKTFQSVELSRDGRYLVASVRHGWVKADVYFQDLREKKPVWKTLVEGQSAIYAAVAHRDRFYVLTDEGAPHYRVFLADPKAPARASWRELVPERKGVTIDDFGIIGGRLALTTIADVVQHLELYELDGKLAHEVALPEPGSVGVSGNEDEDEAYFSFTSFARAPEIHELSVRTAKSSVVYRTKVPVDASAIQTEQLFATSKDGTRVPFFVLRPKTVALDGKAPAWLTGYGGFSRALTPGFTSGAYPWLERGGIHVVANLRGGSEYGEAWHQAGMRRNKQRVFEDFLAVAEELVKKGYTSADRFVIQGGSNGGLLVGAALTQRPELFRVVLCSVPLLDMVRYHLFGSGKTWIEEYGSADDAEDFRALYAYSPYHHVKEGAPYPSVLLLSADSDDRVDPMHARKFAALLQQASTGGPVLLRVEQNAGHGGADRIQALVEQRADAMAFALSELRRAPLTRP